MPPEPTEAHCREHLHQSTSRGDWFLVKPERGSRPRYNEAGLVRDDDRLCAVAELELPEDMADVGLDGLVAEHEAVGDLVIGQALRDGGEDLGLARSE
jgi:hypothetical protein